MRRAIKHKHIISLTLSLVLLLLIFAWTQFNKQPLNFDHVWVETTVPYGSSCGNDCTIVREHSKGGHGSDVKLVVNPNIDDSIAQWGDCVGSIMICYEASSKRDGFGQRREEAMHTCIMESICPVECREHYEAEVNSDMSQVNAKLDDVFLGERAACLPTEAWIE